MLKRLAKRYLAVCVVLACGAQVHAGFLPSSFGFSFLTDFIQNVFFLPFRLVGCLG